MRTLYTAATILLTTASLSAAQVRVVDGDTVVIDNETIRILNIDTPEIRHAQCDAELRLGRVAKRRLEQLLAAGVPVIKRGDKGRMTDKYGRTLAMLQVYGEDVGEQLVREGMARPWDGKRRPWCE